MVVNNKKALVRLYLTDFYMPDIVMTFFTFARLNREPSIF
jgi:hypothetical protein